MLRRYLGFSIIPHENKDKRHTPDGKKGKV